MSGLGFVKGPRAEGAVCCPWRIATAHHTNRGFLGDRTAYAGFRRGLSAEELDWTCTSATATYTPVDPACSKSAINKAKINSSNFCP